ncbi:ankyrin repeat-containing domain protein [Usnea florida]
MGDPLSVTASIIAVLQITGEVYKYGLDFAEAPKAILSLKGEVESLRHLLERLKKRCDDAQGQKPPPSWLQGLWEVRHTPHKNGYEYGGFVWQLQEAVKEAMGKLLPSKEWKNTQAYQRITWHFRKDKIDEIHKTINRYLNAISVILTLKDDETIGETRDLVKEGNEYSRVQFTQLNDHISALERHQNEEEEKRRKEKEEAEREEITNWLSPFSFIAKQDELLDKSVKDVGEFLWSDQRFQAWVEESRPWYLWGVGELGVGKTVLSSILAHRLAQQSSPGSPPPVILSIYLDYKSSQIQTVEHLVGSLLQQLLQLNESLALPDELKTVHKRAKRLGKKSSLCYKDVRRVLTDELKRFDRIYLIVDGFDEMVPNDRLRLLQELRNLKPNMVSILLTSRRFSDETGSYSCRRCLREGLKLVFHCSICGMGEFDICYDCRGEGFWCDDAAHKLAEPYKLVEVPIKFPDGDIERFVRSVIGGEVEDSKVVLTDERDTAVNPVTTRLQDLLHGDPNLPGQIITEVTNKAAGRFLYARLYLDALNQSPNKVVLKKVLRTFPERTDDIYKEAMQRIQKQELANRSRGFRALGIMTQARKTLELGELKHALAVLTLEESGVKEYSENELEDGMDETKTILGSTSSLVVVEANQASLVHKSLEEYLLQEKNRSKWLPDAHFDLARACMLYLQLVLPTKKCQDDYYTSKNAKFPFLQYASQYWGDHIRDASQNADHATYLQDKALQLLGDPQRMDACMQAAWVTNPGGIDTWDVWKGVDRLHICARFGLYSVLSEMDPEPGTVDKEEPKYSQTPLMYACRQGHFEVVNFFLRRGASQKKISARGRTALFEAILGHHSRSGAKMSGALSRHAKVVELLVLEMPGDLDINMTHSQDHDRTALMLAAQKGHLEMIEILLKHPSIGIDMQDAYGATAIVLAVREGHFDIIERLLKANANIEIVDFQVGRSALRCAAERDSAKIVALLLRHNADPSVKDREGGTATLRAVNRGAARVLEEMMNHNVDIECVDEDGQSLLHGAARNGYATIARMLLNEKVLTADVRDKCSMTPLHDASRYGKAAVAAALLENGADASLEDQFGRTPFIVAWQYGREDIMRMLTTASQQQSPISLDDANLPLWAMARRGLTDLLAAAIKFRAQDLHILEPYSEKSPLHCAIEDNEPAILDILLRSQEAFPLVNQRNHFGRTPLHIAAMLGDILASQRLLSAGADLDTKDRWNDRPISLAQANGHLDVMLVLIKADVNNIAVNKREIDLKSLFFFAVEKGDVDAVERLIGVYGVDRSVQNSEGLRAIKIAKAADDVEMVGLLVAAPTVYVGDGEGLSGRKGEAKTYGSEMPFVPFRSRPVDLSG